jgi:hypothetical protein
VGRSCVLVQLAVERITQVVLHLGFTLSLCLLPLLLLLVHRVRFFNHAVLDIAQLFEGPAHLSHEDKLYFF